MGKYTVHLNVLASVSYDVEASSAAEAHKLVMEEEADLADAEGSTWDHDDPGEVLCPDGVSIDINDLEDEDDESEQELELE